MISKFTNFFNVSKTKYLTKLLKDEKYFLMHQNAKLKIFGFSKIPLLLLTQPKVKVLNPTECHIEIPLNYLTKNHLGSMYFGALAMGADCAAGLFAMYLSEQLLDTNISLVFKNFQAQFHQRAEHKVLFKCQDADSIKKILEEAKKTNGRSTHPVHVEAWVMDPKNGSVKAADFQLGLSIKILLP